MGGTASPVKIEESNPVKKVLSFDVPWDNVAKELDQAYRMIGKKARIKGFRAGKTPRKVLEIHYKHEAEEEALSNLITRYYSDALREHDITPVDRPVIEQQGIEQGSDFKFTATVEIEPVVDPKGYCGLALEKRDVKVTPRHVKERIDQIRQVYSTLEEIPQDRAVQNDDFVTMDFTGRVDEEVQKGLTAEDYTLQVGSGTFFKDLEEQLIGVRKDEAREITVTLPEDFQIKEIAGRECVFSVTIKEVKERIMPVVDKNFIKNFEQYDTIKEFKEDVKKSIEEEEERKVKSELETQLVDRLIEKNEFDVPSVYVERQIYMMMLNAQNHMVQNGMKPEEAAKISSKMHDSFKDQAEKTVRASLLLNKIAEKESITCDDTEVEARLTELGPRIKESQRDDMQERIRDELVTQKTIDYLTDKAEISVAKKKTRKKEAK